MFGCPGMVQFNLWIFQSTKTSDKCTFLECYYTDSNVNLQSTNCGSLDHWTKRNIILIFSTKIGCGHLGIKSELQKLFKFLKEQSIRTQQHYQKTSPFLSRQRYTVAESASSSFSFQRKRLTWKANSSLGWSLVRAYGGYFSFLAIYEVFNIILTYVRPVLMEYVLGNMHSAYNDRSHYAKLPDTFVSLHVFFSNEQSRMSLVPFNSLFSYLQLLDPVCIRAGPICVAGLLLCLHAVCCDHSAGCGHPASLLWQTGCWSANSLLFVCCCLQKGLPEQFVKSIRRLHIKIKNL